MFPKYWLFIWNLPGHLEFLFHLAPYPNQALAPSSHPSTLPEPQRLCVPCSLLPGVSECAFLSSSTSASLPLFLLDALHLSAHLNAGSHTSTLTPPSRFHTTLGLLHPLLPTGGPGYCRHCGQRELRGQDRCHAAWVHNLGTLGTCGRQAPTLKDSSGSEAEAPEPTPPLSARELLLSTSIHPIWTSMVAQPVKSPLWRQEPSVSSLWGRSHGEGNGNLPQCSCLENPMDRGAWWTTAHWITKSHPCVTERNNNILSKFCTTYAS